MNLSKSTRLFLFTVLLLLTLSQFCVFASDGLQSMIGDVFASNDGVLTVQFNNGVSGVAFYRIFYEDGTEITTSSQYHTYYTGSYTFNINNQHSLNNVKFAFYDTNNTEIGSFLKEVKKLSTEGYSINKFELVSGSGDDSYFLYNVSYPGSDRTSGNEPRLKITPDNATPSTTYIYNRNLDVKYYGSAASNLKSGQKIKVEFIDIDNQVKATKEITVPNTSSSTSSKDYNFRCVKIGSNYINLVWDSTPPLQALVCREDLQTTTDRGIRGSGTNCFEDSGLQPGKIYTYRLADMNGNFLSGPLKVSTNPIPASDFTANSIGSDKIKLQWTKPQGDSIDQYIILKGLTSSSLDESSNFANAEYIYVEPSGINESYIDTNVTANKTYYYKLAALNGSKIASYYGAGLTPSAVSATPTVVAASIKAPTITNIARINDTQAQITWERIPDITVYNVETSTNNFATVGFQGDLTRSANTSTYTATITLNVAQGGTLSVRVKAKSGSTYGPVSNVVSLPITPAVISVTSISLKATTSLTVNGIEKLTATIVPSNATTQTVSWKSDKPAVASVDVTGMVTGVSEGTATITATTADGGKTASCTVTVSKAVIPIASVSIKAATSLTVNGTEKLAATIAPSNATTQTVSWKSDKPAVASVDSNGTVTGVSEGSAIITVTTTDGGKIASCTVTVSKAVIPIASVSIKTATSLIVNGTEKLTATILPSNATTQTVSWKSDKPAVASVDSNGVVIGVSEGSAIITVTTTDGGKIASCIVTVSKVAIPVASVSIKESTSLTVKAAEKLTATILPSNATTQTVSWKSDKPAVASVDSNGIVTGISQGSATITVTTTDGNKYDTCIVTVYDTALPISPVMTFNDLPNTHWSYTAITELSKYGIVKGFTDGSFQPRSNVSREEFAAMLHRCVNPLEIENPAVPSFKDIQGRWSYLEIEAVKEFFEGTQKSDGLYFNPINNAKREDIIYSLVKAKGYQDESYDISTLSVFTDKADISPDKVKYVAIAYKLGLVKGASVDGKLLLNPKLGVTRAETAQFLYNAFIK